MWSRAWHGPRAQGRFLLISSLLGFCSKAPALLPPHLSHPEVIGCIQSDGQSWQPYQPSLTLTCFQKSFQAKLQAAALDWPLRAPGPHAGCHSWKPSHLCMVLPCSKAWGLESAQVVDNYRTCCCLHLDEALFKSIASPKSFVIFLGPRTCSHRATTLDGLGGLSGTPAVSGACFL